MRNKKAPFLFSKLPQMIQTAQKARDNFRAASGIGQQGTQSKESIS